MSRPPKDIKNQKFGRLRTKEYKQGRWLCSCDCGNETTVLTAELLRGRTQSCGCLMREVNSTKSTKIVTGERYGRATVIRRESSANNRSRWLCSCDCGETFVAEGSNLRSGNTQSCGCYHAELCSALFKNPKEIYAK